MLSKNSWPIIANLIFLACLGLAGNFNRLPSSSGDATLLYPSKSESLSWLKFRDKHFGNYQHDLISLFANSAQDELLWDLEELEFELGALNGIESVIIPSNKKRNRILRLTRHDSKFQRIIIKINSNLQENEKLKLNKKINLLIKKYPQLSLKRTGVFFITQSVTEWIDQEVKRVIPILMIILFILLIIFLKDFRLVLLILFSNIMALGTTLLIFGLFNFKIGPIAQLAPPFLLAVGASFNLHVATRLRQTSHVNFEELKLELRQGIAIAALTTIFSLLSLIFLDIQGVTDFAICAALGTLISALYSLLLLPPYIKPKLSNSEPLLKNFVVEKLLKQGKRLWIFVIFAIVAVFSFGIPKLKIHTDPIKFIPKNSSQLEQIKINDQRFPGNHFLSIILKNKNSTNLNKPQGLKSLVYKIKKLKGVYNTVSYLDFLNITKKEKDLIKSFSLTETKIPADLFNPEIGAYQIIVETKYEGRDLLRLNEKIGKIIVAEHEITKNFDLGTTSMELIMAEQTTFIVKGLIQSLGTTLLTVFLIALVYFRSFKIAIIALVPNIIPLLSVFGFIGISSATLDFGSCLVASVALGLAVDNTFHFLLCWNKNKSVVATVIETAESFITTTAILFVTFLTMTLAQVAPVANFGLYLSISLLTGVLADLYVLPILLAKCDDNNNKIVN